MRGKARRRERREIKMAVFLELSFLGAGLAMDAFAVAVCKGLAMRRVNRGQAVVDRTVFGGFRR